MTPVTLKIGNSISSVTGLSASQEKDLKALLSYSPTPAAAYYSGAYKAHRRYLIDKRGSFPTGLLYIVLRYLKESGLKTMTTDTRIAPKKLEKGHEFKCGLNLRTEQFAAAKACVDTRRGIISAPTGTGKSLIIALIIDMLQVRTLIVVPSLELKRQLTETLKENFGTLAVGRQGDGLPIAVENVDALDPKEVCTYDCVIIDEFHHSGAKTYRQLNKKAWNSVYYRFGLTATPFRTNENERLLLESVLSKVVYRLEYNTAVENNYIVPIEPYFYRIPLTKTDAYSWGEAYSELIVNKKERNEVICSLVKSLHEMNQSTLVLVDQIKHGELLQYLMAEKGIKVPFANGQDEDSKQMIADFNAKKYPVLLGSSILGEGVDTKPCEWVILAGGSGKSKGRLMQMCGRAVRLYPNKYSAKIISFFDPSHKWFKKHHAFFVKTMKEEYGVAPAEFLFDLK